MSESVNFAIIEMLTHLKTKFMMFTDKNLDIGTKSLKIGNQIIEHLNFGHLLWGRAKSKNLKKIKSLQKRCIRNAS